MTEKIRENQQFANLDELVHQLNTDKAYVSKNPRIVMTFGTFDHTHAGHLAYLTQARLHGDHLVTIVALDQTVKQVKSHETVYKETKRLHDVQDMHIPNHSVQL